jgi:1-phosphofructokinase family hexose kinase
MILVAGLTPAWQQVLCFDSFTPGAVNRARQVHWCASGKVLNVARALSHLDAPAKALTVVGGSTGAAIEHDFQRLDIPARWIKGTSPTRVCTTILDRMRQEATELVPNAADLTSVEREAFITAYGEEVRTVTTVVLIGSLPVATPPAFYHDLLMMTTAKAILDVRGPELLETLRARPFLVKLNRPELEQTLSRTLDGETNLIDGVQELHGRGAEWVVVTDGRNPISICSNDGCYRVSPPPKDVVNPIGCGDCMAAGIAAALSRGRDPLDAIRYGIATAADKVSQVLPGLVARERVDALLKSVLAVEI